MGNNNATAILTEEESSKLETNEKSPLGTVPRENTQDQLVITGEGKDGDKEKESSKLETNGVSPLGSVSIETTQDQVFLAGEGKDEDIEKESSKLETNGLSPLDSDSVETMQDQVFLSGDGKDGEKEKESSMLETNGMSTLDSVSVETMQDQVFFAGDGKDGEKEKESSKLETNGMSPLDSVSIETMQDQVFLASDGNNGEKEKESSKLETDGMSLLDSVVVETMQDQFFLAGEGKDGDVENESLLDGVTETEPKSKELVDEPKVKFFEEEMDPSDLECLVMKTDEQLPRQTSVVEGFEIVCEAREVVELSMIETQSVVSKLNSTESGNEGKLCVNDESVFVSPSTFEIVGSEEKMVNESLEKTVPSEEVVKLDKETIMEQREGRERFPEIEPQEILNLDHYRVVDDEEVTNEGNTDKAISNPKPDPEESNAIKETSLGVKKEEKKKREESLKRMSRCRSLPVSQNSRVIGDTLIQHLVSKVVFPSRNRMALEKGDTSETLLVSCGGSNKEQETTEAITESNKEARLEMRSPSFRNDLRIEERSDESTEKTPLLCQDKTEIYEATIDVEEKTVMLKRSGSVKTRGLERSLEFLKKHSDSFKETKGSEDYLVDKKASSGSMKGIVRKRSKSSLFGTCLCCTTAMN